MTHALPNPDVHFERYHVDQGGKRYIVEFARGKPREVQVRMARSTYRTIFYGLYQGDDVAPTGRAAEVISYILNPAEAERCGAEVQDPATYMERSRLSAAKFSAEIARSRAAAAAAKRLADAAPALLAALQAMVRVHSNATYGSLAARIEAKAAALAAIAQAEGV